MIESLAHIMEISSGSLKTQLTACALAEFRKSCGTQQPPANTADLAIKEPVLALRPRRPDLQWPVGCIRNVKMVPGLIALNHMGICIDGEHGVQNR